MIRYLLGIIGNPLAFTLSPKMQSAALNALGLPWHYFSLPVPPSSLHAALEGVRVFPFRGVNITMPYKEVVVKWLDELEGDAEILSAVNTITVEDMKLVGRNTDADGIYCAMKSAVEPNKKTFLNYPCLIVGAGGAARGAALAMRRFGFSSLLVVNRSKRRGMEMVKFCKDVLKFKKVQFELLKDFLQWNIREKSIATVLVSAVPKEAVTLKLWQKIKTFTEPLCVCELAYGKDKTSLERYVGKQKKIVWVSGKEVLLHQGALSLKQWTGKRAPIHIMKDALLP